jgi:WD40 repeat protein
MTREESQRIFNEQLEESANQDGSILDRYFNSLDFNTKIFPPSFDGKKIWETVVFKQNIDEIAWHTTLEKTTLLARNGSQWFYLVNPETGMVTDKFEPNFHETWDNDNKVFIELSDSSLRLCQSNPVIQQAYWNYVHNKHIHSIFDPFAHYEDENGNTRLRKTAYFRSITSKDQSLIAYINKGEKYAYIKIHSMSDHRHIQTINTGVPGNHDCQFFDGNQKIIVGSDDGIIRIFDIATGELIHKLKGHNDSVFCLDINPNQTELISGSADGIWKLWSLKQGDDFGLCIHTSEQLVTKYNKPIQIYHTQFSPDQLFIFVVTDIGRIQIFLRESLRLQTNLYDKYQRHMQATGEPTILSLLINHEEKCFYVGYANGKMQKWV